MRMRTTLLLTCLVLAPLTVSAEEFKWVDAQPGQTDLMLGDQPVLRYMHAYDDSSKDSIHDTYKVFHHVFGPGSKQLITKGAGGKYTHHRGLYVGWNKTKTSDGSFDFWHCKNGAHLRHMKTLEQTVGKDDASMTTLIHWNDAEGKPVIEEVRRVEVRPLQDASQGWQIDWSTKLTSQRGTIQLDGDRQHAGFQFRAAQEVADANGAKYIRPPSFPQQAEAIQVGDKGNPPPHINLGWFAMTFEVAGKRYTAAYFEDPSLPKPSLFSERPYGRFGAFFKTELTPDKPFTMHYRVLVFAGEAPSATDLNQRYKRFVEQL